MQDRDARCSSALESLLVNRRVLIVEHQINGSVEAVVVGSGVYWLMSFKLLPEQPEFTRYAERVTSRPAFIRAAEKDAELAKSLAQ